MCVYIQRLRRRRLCILFSFLLACGCPSDGWTTRHYRIRRPVSYKNTIKSISVHSAKDSSNNAGGPSRKVEDDAARRAGTARNKENHHHDSAATKSGYPHSDRSKFPIKRQPNPQKGSLNTHPHKGHDEIQEKPMKTSNRFDKRKARLRARVPRSPSSIKASDPGKGTSSSFSPSSYSSLLPPIHPSGFNSHRKRVERGDDDDSDALIGSLSSWEEFLGAAPNQEETRPSPENDSHSIFPGHVTSGQDVLPTNASLDGTVRSVHPRQSRRPPSDRQRESLNGALPISDLFYSSNKALAQKTNQSIEGVVPVSELFYRSNMSNTILTGKAKGRGSGGRPNKKYAGSKPQLSLSAKSDMQSSQPKKQRDRRIIRRGMETLVGGVSINAEPPQRAIELSYRPDQTDWALVITVNSKDFGRVLHADSIMQMSDQERGLYCEYWVHAALKWNVCPDDLREIVESHLLMEEQMTSTLDEGSLALNWDTTVLEPGAGDEDDIAALILDGMTQLVEQLDKESSKGFGEFPFNTRAMPRKNIRKAFSKVRSDVEKLKLMQQQIAAAASAMAVEHMIDLDDERSIASSGVTSELGADTEPDEETTAQVLSGVTATLFDSLIEKLETHFFEDSAKKRSSIDENREAPKGFGKLTSSSRAKNQKDHLKKRFRLIQKISVPREDLVSGTSSEGRSPIENVFLSAFKMMIGELDGFEVTMSKLDLVEQDDGVTSVEVEFTVNAAAQCPKPTADLQRRLKEMRTEFRVASESGYFDILVARAAKKETGWSEQVRNQVVNECLLADDDVNQRDENFAEEDSDTAKVLDATYDTTSKDPYMESVDGLYPDYSVSNARNAPYRGQLGLQLLDAVVEHAKKRIPRVIAIGDVHGCIDELQELLCECDYRPGDQVVLLGDLVCKGPGSLAVVEMCREIGAIAVCGNHDFEVRRWQKAIERVEKPSVGTEHFRIASRLSKADMKWMDNLPWYISSRELGALFVHAGFVSGIRLAKQNPRLMTNMRSILPDGTVTSKFFNNWPWARLWDGPQTVLFGHDADRGLQQYEHAIGLDTGCVYGGRLTACILPERKLVSVNAKKQYFRYRRKHYD